MTTTRQRIIPISDNGRMNLPAEMRRALGVRGSGYLVLTLDENGIRITTQQQALKRIRELASPYKPDRGLASEQLIEARRKEAVREDDEMERKDDG